MGQLFKISYKILACANEPAILGVDGQHVNYSAMYGPFLGELIKLGFQYILLANY